ncbi:MAG: hypothetical protein ACREJ3_00445 [Polyangiaceae bacterium]
MEIGDQRLVAVARHMYFIERVPMKEVVFRLRAMGVVDSAGKPYKLTSIFEMIHSRRWKPPERTPR